MTIEIHQPEIEALIQQRLQSGAFRDVEDVLMQALKSSPGPAMPVKEESVSTGADLVADMQASPYKDIDLEPYRPHLPVRDVAF
jgi:hypothetical protein